MLIGDLIKELAEIVEFHGNQEVSISLNFEADNLMTHIESPYKHLWIEGWRGGNEKCLYTEMPEQKELEL